MFSFKEKSLKKSSTNDGFVGDLKEDDEGTEKSTKKKSNLTANSNEPLSNDAVQPQRIIPPIITITGCDLSSECSSIAELSDICESAPNPHSTVDNFLVTDSRKSVRNESNREKPYTNLGFENMSISNFKLIQGLHSSFNRSNSSTKSNYKAEEALSSPIQMKNVKSELIFKTGENYLKTSTFLVSRKESNFSMNEEELLDIKLIDKPSLPELFIEFDSLHINPLTNHYCWVERSRWLKFEEDYNPETRRFDRPHLSPISLIGITNFKFLFAKGEAVLDCHQQKFINVLNNISESIIKNGEFSDKEIIDIRNALILKHYHAGETMQKTSSEVSLYQFDNDNKCFQPHLQNVKRNPNSFSLLDNSQRIVSHIKLDRRLPSGTESFSVQVGALESLHHTFSLFVRLDPPIRADGLNEVSCPLRFLFIVFGPKSKEEELIEIGRVFSVMMSNLEFREIGYSAKVKEEILAAIDVFMSHSVLVPLNKVITHDSLSAMLPQMKRYYKYNVTSSNERLFDHIQRKLSKVPDDEGGLRRRLSLNSHVLRHGPDTFTSTIDDHERNSESKFDRINRRLKPFCSPFRYFYYDWIGLKSRYVSDYRDAFKKEHAQLVFIGMLFIYFVVMVPAITFGALLNRINPQMTLTMMLLSSGFFQFFYSLFGGQPFEIIGITGPVFAVEIVLSSLSSLIGLQLGAMRFWIGVYMSILGVFFTAFNGVIIIQYIRISVEEIYSFLVDAIYILSALFYMFKSVPYSIKPIIANKTSYDDLVNERLRFGIGGVTLFLSFLMANVCIFLVKIKNGSFFSRQIRGIVGSLSVPIGILLIVAMKNIFFDSYNLPTLNVQPINAINISMLFNIPSRHLTSNVAVKTHALCFAISISLFTILVCEVSTNSITASKSERKLVKPSLYSINYFFILVMFPLISGSLGWPFVSGAPVRSHAHCMAMSIWSVNLPGIKAKVIGAAEQRVSGVFVGLLVALSIFLGSVLRCIPMAAMYGMFLYMGIMGASDLIFIRRLISILQHRKYWTSHDYLKDFPTWHIVTLVLIQLLFVSILIVLNCIAEFTTIKWTPLLFPVIILIFGFVRGYILPRWPRLNTHLSKMDRKHPIKLYADQHAMEQVVVTVEQQGGNLKVLESKAISIIEDHYDSSSDMDEK